MKEAKIAGGRTQGKMDDEDGGCLINGRESEEVERGG